MSKNSRVLETGTNQITQKYSAAHKANDIVKYKSQLDNIIAHSDGTVTWVQTGQKNNKTSTGDKSYGNAVKIDHGNGYETLYAHLNNVTVKKGQKVKKGEVLGRMGNTGRSFGAHLHFEVRKNGSKIDPTPYINADLPKPVVVEPKAKYRVYAGSKWYGTVTDYNDKNSDGYAGVQGKDIRMIAVDATQGTIKFRVHYLKGSWSAWTTTSNITKPTGYAGSKTKKIDAVQMTFEGLDGYDVKYRVSPTKAKTWYGWCVGKKDATGDGYAGEFGQPIDCIQVDIVKV